MAGLYIHIPFCRTKCAYCDFYSLPLTASILKPDSGNYMERYCSAVLAEFRLRSNEINEPFSTIYIGGGTPTAVPMAILVPFLQDLTSMVAEHNRSITALHIQQSDNPHEPDCRNLASQKIVEFTIEANPEDITENNLNYLTATGVNRISIGIQSFSTCRLNAVERFHDAPTSIAALETLRGSGLNYSADLIYGLPGQSTADWNDELKRLLSFNPPHFSSYLLSYEPGTRLYARKESGLLTETDELTASKMYDILCRQAAENGYCHYEISNFAKTGREAIHNSSYWNLTPYLGLGCSAHSFDGITRRANPCNLKKYMADITQGESPAVIEEETLENQVNDYIITSLRTAFGLSLQFIALRWGEKIGSAVERNLKGMIESHRLHIDNSTGLIRIPEALWLTSDAILREIIL